MADENFPAWSHNVQEVAVHHGANVTQGLPDAAVEEKREKYGYNELTAEEKTPLWKLVLAQFDDSLVKVCENI